MNRREFLKTVPAAGALLGAGAVVATTPAVAAGELSTTRGLNAYISANAWPAQLAPEYAEFERLIEPFLSKPCAGEHQVPKFNPAREV